MSTRGYTSPVSSQKQDEPSSSGVLNYRNASPELKNKIDESRLTEWTKYQHITASIPIKGEELEALLAEGHVVIPSKWVETIKNWFERHKPGFEPQYQSRLIGCGNFEQDDGVRTDAPTSDLETHSPRSGRVCCMQSDHDSEFRYLERLFPGSAPRQGNHHATASRRTTWSRSGGGIVGKSSCVRFERLRQRVLCQG